MLGCCSPSSGCPLPQGIPFLLRVEAFCGGFAAVLPQVVWRVLALGEALRSIRLFDTRGLGVVWGSVGQSVGWVLWWFGEEEGGVLWGSGHGAPVGFPRPGRRGERIREQDPNIQTLSPSWGLLAALGSSTAAQQGRMGTKSKRPRSRCH